MCDELHTRTADELSLTSPSVLAELVVATHKRHEKMKLTAPPKQPFLARRVRFAATCCVLLLMTTALAMVANHALGGGPSAHCLDAEQAEAGPALVPTAGPGPDASDTLPSGSLEEGDAISFCADLPTVTQFLDKEAKAPLMRAGAEAVLPKNDKDFEAWARNEYPHILWLYDVLMGNVPEVPANSPAGNLVSFGVDRAGNPTITLPRYDHSTKTFAFYLPSDHLPGQPLWDLNPVNLPDWWARVYADIQPDERPTGWRALLVCSGEIFKLESPATLESPCCLPTLVSSQS